MMTTIAKPSGNSTRDPWQKVLDAQGWRGTVILVVCFSLLAYFVATIFQETTDPSLVDQMTQAVSPHANHVVSAGVVSSGHVIGGTVNGVSYDHCAAHTPDRDIVLLHGAKFTRKDWQTSKIMPLLCAHGYVSVTAIDLPVQADGEALRKVLRGLAFGEGVLQPEGNYVLVTPSASGKAIVDWINQGDHEELVETVGLWIPIASPAIASVDKGKLASLRDQGWPILALYGDKDTRGKEVSEKLANEGGAKVKEFPGPHPFYFDIPKQFSDFLLNDIHEAINGA
jgi:pimeloyl-ACP methyl ester carboxylesterase